MYNAFYYDTKIGKIGIVENGHSITKIYFDEISLADIKIEETPLLRQAYEQINEYLSSQRQEFQLPIELHGTEFQKKVWNALQEIPYGKTCSYKEIAEKIGNPKACRAVGLANNRNPISIIVPCHRVIGANGKLVGYGGGLEIKSKLLELEKTHNTTLTDYSIKNLKTYIMRSFKESGKKHLLITGNKKAGKTSVLREILKEEGSFEGIITYVIRDDKMPPKYVMLQDMNNPSIKDIIARRNEDGKSLIPLVDTFEKLGTSILNKYINSNIDLIVIDEIGFLENSAMGYQNTVLNCLDKKNVIFVLRKESSPFIERIINRDDVCFVDIDCIRNY